jgi:hypothetical protein
LKITIFNGKIHYKWPFSIAMLNYQRVSHIPIIFPRSPLQKNHLKLLSGNCPKLSFGGLRGISGTKGLRLGRDNLPKLRVPRVARRGKKVVKSLGKLRWLWKIMENPPFWEVNRGF